MAEASINIRATREAVGVLTRNRMLLWELAKRDVSERYVGQAFGFAWAIGHPLFLMALYVFIFAVVFKVRIPSSYEMPLDYTAYILSGLIPWLSFQEAMNKSCTCITGSASLVKQTVFPLELLPAKGVVTALFTQVVTTTVLVLYLLAAHGSLHLTYLALPLLFVLQAVAMTGVALLLASVSPFFRDTKDIVQLFGVAGVYLLPIVYLPHWIPDIFKPLMYANPFSYMIWCYQDVLYYGRLEHPWAWVVFASFSALVFAYGYRSFRKLKSLFGNVL